MVRNTLRNDDNFKNILQVKIQKEFKTTPDYIEIKHDVDQGYEMGVYLCLGKPLHQMNIMESIPFSKYGSFEKIQEEFIAKSAVFVFLGSGIHKIKKKAEQIASEIVIKMIDMV